MTNLSAADHVLAAAARVAGLATTGAELIRDGSNAVFALPDGVVARVGRPGVQDVAWREIQVSRWLSESGIAVVQALPDVPQPVVIDDRPVTWWVQIPEHRSATPGELGAVLRALHKLPLPAHLDLPQYDPFGKLNRRVVETPGLSHDDRSWLTRHLAELYSRYQQLPVHLEHCVIHGDAWQGNIAVPANREPVLMDLEVVSLGSPEWDLVQIAVDHVDFARLDEAAYRSFVNAYGGYDVTTSPRFRTLADIQELHWVCFALSKSETNSTAANEARHRLACLRGEVPRPWTWNAI